MGIHRYIGSRLIMNNAVKSMKLSSLPRNRFLTLNGIPCKCRWKARYNSNYAVAATKWSSVTSPTHNPLPNRERQPYFIWSSSSSSNEGDDESNKKENENNGNDNGSGLMTLFILGAGLLYIGFNRSNPELLALPATKEITVNEFIHQLLKTGDVEYLTVNMRTASDEPQGNTRVSVHMRRGAMVDGEPVTQGRPYCYFHVSNVRNFELRLLEAQADLGIKSKDNIPVWYQRRTLDLNFLGYLKIAAAAGIAAIIWSVSKGKGVSMQGGMDMMKNSPFGSMTRAKTTIVNPGTKKGNVKVGT